MYYYQTSNNSKTMVSTCNEKFARLKGRKLMKRSLILSVLSQEKVKKFKPKFDAKTR